MSKTRYFKLSLVLLLSSMVYTGMAQDEDFRFSEEESKQTRKERSMLRRPKEKDPKLQLEYADKLVLQGEKKAAEKQYRALVHQWRDAPQAAEAQFKYANLLERRGKFASAFREYQYLVDNYSGVLSHEKIIERQFKIANYIMTKKRMKIWFGGYRAPEYALPLFEQIVKNAPKWKNAAEAQFNIGLIHEEKEDYAEAIQAYDIIISRYAESDLAASSGFRRAQCFCIKSQKRPRDETTCISAISAVSAYISAYPGDPNVKEAKEELNNLKDRLASFYFSQALFYDKMGNKPKAALIAYSNFVKKFPWSEKIKQANQRIAELKTELEKVDE